MSQYARGKSMSFSAEHLLRTGEPISATTGGRCRLMPNTCASVAVKVTIACGAHRPISGPMAVGVGAGGYIPVITGTRRAFMSASRPHRVPQPEA